MFLNLHLHLFLPVSLFYYYCYLSTTNSLKIIITIIQDVVFVDPSTGCPFLLHPFPLLFVVMAAPSNSLLQWSHDDALLSVSAVEWVSKAVFLAAVPSLQRKVSCELIGIDVPRGTWSSLLDQITATLRAVNGAIRIYLRLDHYSNFPMEGYGDIIFSKEQKAGPAPTELQWCSLQETLLVAGVGCVTRPVVYRAAELFAAEDKGFFAAAPCGWLRELRQREQSTDFCFSQRCRVEDVIRGDIYRVSWLSEDAIAASLPPLVILDSTICAALNTEVGFMGLRWSQLHLYRQELFVSIHTMYPGDSAVALSTQVEMYEQLPNVRCTAYLNSATAAHWDVGLALLQLGYAKLRRVVDAGFPRSANFASLCQWVGTEAHRSARDGELSSSAEVASDVELFASKAHMDLCTLWRLPPNCVEGLLEFLGSTWRCFFMAQATVPSHKQPFNVPRCGATRQAWRQYLHCGDIHSDPSSGPSTCVYRPLRTLFPLDGIAARRERLRGFISAITSTSTTQDPNQHFLQVEVTTVVPQSQWRGVQKSLKQAEVGTICFHPSPSEVVFPGELRVVVNGIVPRSVSRAQLRISCCSYPAEGFALQHHRTSKDWLEVDGTEYAMQLSAMGAGGRSTVYVVDIVLEVRDEFSLEWKRSKVESAVYVLSPHIAARIDDVLPGGEQVTSQDDKDKDAAVTMEDLKVQHPVDPIFLSKVFFFFKIHGGDVAEDGFVENVLQRCSYLVYQDTLAVAVGVAEINGVRGLVGDLLFFSEATENNAASLSVPSLEDSQFHLSLLWGIGGLFWAESELDSSGSTDSSSMMAEISNAVIESYALEMDRVMHLECKARCKLLDEIQFSINQVAQKFSTTLPILGGMEIEPFALDMRCQVLNPVKTCLYYFVGATQLWRDVTARGGEVMLIPSAFPSIVPLSLFSAFPVKLFCSSGTHQKSFAPETQSLSALHSSTDFAIRGLAFPALPNIFMTNFEQLPHSLRNTERALCDAVLEGRATAGSVSTPPLLYASDDVLSKLLAYLFLLQSAQIRRTGGATPSCEDAVYSSVRNYCASVWEILKGHLNFSGILYTLCPSSGATAASDSTDVLYFASHRAMALDAWDVPTQQNRSPEVLSFPLDLEVLRHCVEKVAFEILTTKVTAAPNRPESAKGQCAGGERFPSTKSCINTRNDKALPFGRNDNGTSLLYHPLPWLAVLGSPLVQHTEYSAEALGEIGIDTNIFDSLHERADALAQRMVSLSYHCVGTSSEKDPYRGSSHDLFSDRYIYNVLNSHRACGREVIEYMSLLLRQLPSKDDGAAGSAAKYRFGDGSLSVYGTACEPLYAHYRSRADLRFTLGTINPLLQEGVRQCRDGCGDGGGDDAQLARAVQEFEHDTFQYFAKKAFSILKELQQHIRKMKRNAELPQLFLSFTLKLGDDAGYPTLSIIVYRCVEYSDANVVAYEPKPASHATSSSDAPANPYRAYSFTDTVLRELPMAEMIIFYDTDEKSFKWTWNGRMARV